MHFLWFILPIVLLLVLAVLSGVFVMCKVFPDCVKLSDYGKYVRLFGTNTAGSKESRRIKMSLALTTSGSSEQNGAKSAHFKVKFLKVLEGFPPILGWMLPFHPLPFNVRISYLGI